VAAEDARPFEGKTALVTGGSRGIGRAVARKLAAGGADLIVNYAHNEDAANETVAALKALGVKATALRADMGDLDEVHQLFVRAKAVAGGLDVLVNSAARGLQRPRSAMKSLPNHLRQTFDVNVLGPWFAAKAAAPLMEGRPGGGAIVNLTSLGAQRYMPNYAAVGVTKGALDSLTLYLAVELAPLGIRVNSVCPSWVEETAGVSALPADFGEALRRATPAGRHVSAEDVADLVAFLCGPESTMVVGQNIIIDGGLSLVGPFESA
jgi:enoyl-[acyl-carrier protein] reductase III